jgi:hypothetical protein
MWTVRRLRKLGAQIIVAPYEADAQLGYLARTKAVDCVLTVDGDLLCFGCDWIIREEHRSKPDGYESIHLSDALVQLGLRSVEDLQVLAACIGCDYNRIQGVGSKTALKAMEHAMGVDGVDIDKVINYLKLSDEQARDVRLAVLAFRCQLVFEPTTGAQVPVGESLDQALDDLGLRALDQATLDKYTGQLIPANICAAHMKGSLYALDCDVVVDIALPAVKLASVSAAEMVNAAANGKAPSELGDGECKAVLGVYKISSSTVCTTRGARSPAGLRIGRLTQSLSRSSRLLSARTWPVDCWSAAVWAPSRPRIARYYRPRLRKASPPASTRSPSIACMCFRHCRQAATLAGCSCPSTPSTRSRCGVPLHAAPPSSLSARHVAQGSGTHNQECHRLRPRRSTTRHGQ